MAHETEPIIEQDQPDAGLQQKILQVPAREKVAAYRRTITASDVTYTCARCKQEVTKSLFPGRMPLYCDVCAKEVEREKTRARVARLRAGKKSKKLVRVSSTYEQAGVFGMRAGHAHLFLPSSPVTRVAISHEILKLTCLFIRSFSYTARYTQQPGGD